MQVKISSDQELVKEIKKQLQLSNGYCPCQLVQNEDTKCMCKEFREMEEGTCHCGLYIKTL